MLNGNCGMGFVSTSVTVVLISEVKPLPNKGSEEIPFYKLVALGLKCDLVSAAFILFHGIKIFFRKVS